MTLFALPLPGGITLDNPLFTLGGKAISRPGHAISEVLPYLFLFGGIILFAMLLMGGFEIMTSMGNEEKLQAGKGRITNALLGFMLLFGVYWLAQIAQIIFKIQIL